MSGTDKKSQAFEEAADQEQIGIVAEFVEFLLHNKKWWIAPIVAVLLMFGILIMLGGTAAAPFIYTLF